MLWHASWRALAAELASLNLGDSGDVTQAHQYEAWEHMGYLVDSADQSIWAEFRHRHHPKTGEREYVRVEITEV